MSQAIEHNYGLCPDQFPIVQIEPLRTTIIRPSGDQEFSPQKINIHVFHPVTKQLHIVPIDELVACYINNVILKE